jgi:FtsP/CotA-like multicopper oxidase with cupredoxin domain
MPAMRGGGAMSGMDHSRMGQNGTMHGGPMAQMTSAMRMGINGHTYDMTRIDAEVTLGTQEIWEIRSTEMAHPFHIHGATFRTLSKNGKATPAYEGGNKDTVLVDRSAELLVSFLQPSTREKPFVFHCHILEHEELGMMATYLAATAA